MKYAFIQRHRRVWPISVQCRVLGVSVDRAFPANRLLASATLDRLCHNAYCMVLDRQSYRAPKMAPAPSRSRAAVASAAKPSHP